MAITLTPDLTRVPVRLTPAADDPGNIGLGPTKSNGRTTVDYAKELDMTEENYLRDACIYLMRYVGAMRTGESKDALPAGLMSLRDTLLRMGDADYSQYRWKDDFEYRAAGILDPRWVVTAGACVTTMALRGTAEIPLDGGVETILRMNGYHFYRASLPVIHTSCEWTSIDAANGPTRIGFRDAAANEGWGVEWAPATSPFFRAYTLIGGAYTYTAFDKGPTAGVYSNIRIWIDGTPGAQYVHATIDGTTVVSAVSALALMPQSPLVTVGSGGVAGKAFDMDWVALEADFGAENT